MAISQENESFLQQAAGLIASAVSTVMQDGTIAAAGREAIKDVRSTMFDVFFGQPERGGEPGAPLNPTQGEVAEMRRADDLPSPSEIAAETRLYQPPPDQGNSQDQSQGR